MSATRRRNIADVMDELDRQIWDLQASKKDAYTSYREALKKDGLRDADVKTEIEALKKSIALRRKIIETPGAVDEMDAKVDEILADLLAKRKVGTEYATHARHAPREAAAETPHDPDTGEIVEPAPGCMADPSPQDDALASMLAATRGHVMTDADREAQARGFAYGNAAIDNPLVTREMVASAPHRVTDPAPAPVAVDPDMSPLVADAAARQAAARKLLGQEAAAE